MQIQQINKTDAERVLLVIKNVDGTGSMTTGLGVALALAGASVDGISSMQATAALQAGFIGVAAQDIAINSFGLVTSWGYAASVQISGVGTSITVTAGDFLKAGAVAGTFFSAAITQGAGKELVSTLLYRYVTVATSQTISANPVWTAGVVRAL